MAGRGRAASLGRPQSPCDFGKDAAVHVLDRSGTIDDGEARGLAGREIAKRLVDGGMIGRGPATNRVAIVAVACRQSR